MQVVIAIWIMAIIGSCVPYASANNFLANKAEHQKQAARDSAKNAAECIFDHSPIAPNAVVDGEHCSVTVDLNITYGNARFTRIRAQCGLAVEELWLNQGPLPNA